MRSNISPITIISRVPRHIHTSRKNGDIPRRRHNPGHSVDIILWTNMHKSERQWGQSRDRVIIMRDSEIAALVLIGDVIAQDRGCDTRRAIGVKIGVGARLPDLGGGDISDGAAEAVAYNDDLIIGVSLGGGFEGREDAGAGFEPAIIAMVGSVQLPPFEEDYMQ